MRENEIGKVVVDTALRIHRELGPGLLESVYEAVLAHELRGRDMRVEKQVSIPVEYHGLRFDKGFRIDLLVEDKVIIEIKCVETINNVHRKQLLTYLRLACKRLGYLLNFGEPLMKDGISRIVNGLRERND